MRLISGQKCGQKLKSISIDSPIGLLCLTGCVNGLHRLTRSDTSFAPNSHIKVKIIESTEDVVNEEWIQLSFQWLQSYFERPDQHIGVQKPDFCPFVTQSEFYRKVWMTLMNEISFGQTISYSDLAVKAVGNKSAGRPVGTAMKNNPFLLMVPCHRVIKKDRSTGQFSAGPIKDWLLNHEKGVSNK